jgi:phosphohistidine phosphatase
MKQIYLIRHAKSSWEFPELNDLVRPLAQRGKTDVVRIGNYIAENNIKPDYIISSPATRALHTAIEIANIAAYDTNKIDIAKVIYFGDETEIIKYIQTIDDKFNTIFVFGHEPVLSLLIEQLSDVVVDKFPTCAIFGVEFKTNNWRKIKKGTQSIFITPKMI